MENSDDVPENISGNAPVTEADEPKTYDRPSDRMFRRSRAAQMRRQTAANKEAKFMRFITGIAGLALLLTFLFFFMFADIASAAEAVIEAAEAENTSKEMLMAPIVGKFTVLDVAGVAFILCVGYAVLRRYKNKG